MGLLDPFLGSRTFWAFPRNTARVKSAIRDAWIRMVSITRRRILKEGGGRALALPPHWLDALGLDCGDSLEVIYDDDVLTRPIGQNTKPLAISRELALLGANRTREGIRG